VLARAIAEGPGPDQPPGLYAGLDRRVALNVVAAETALEPAVWPASAKVETLEVAPERSLKGGFLTAALAMLLVDVLAALWVAGRLSGLRRGAAVLALAALSLGLPSGDARAQEADAGPQPGDDFAIQATTAVVLAHVLTGDAQVDELAAQGLAGLGDRLWERTAIEPAMPMAVDIERDELAFFPFLYWPVTADMATPSAKAYEKLNEYLRTGGMILFDTRDAEICGFWRHHARRRGAATNRRGAGHSAAGADPGRPCADPHLLSVAGFSPAATRRGRSGSRPRPPMPRWRKGCRSAA
jgi:hypothetical protein